MNLNLEIPELTANDLDGSYADMLPAINDAIRIYIVNRIHSAWQVPPSSVEPKLKTLARGGTISKGSAKILQAVELELARASAQIQSTDAREIASRAAANVRARIEFNKKHKGKGTHTGNRDLVHLVGSLASEWMEHTDKFPGVTRKEGAITGEFFDFTHKLLDVMTKKISPELLEAAPSLKVDLNKKVISPDALHRVFRGTRLSQLKSILKN